MMRRWLCLLFLLLMGGMAGATGLDGRTVILIVSEHRENDPAQAAIKAELERLRTELGFGQQEMPIVSMGFADSDTDRMYFDRLGFKAEDTPVICVAEWGNPARFGPKKVLGSAIVRRAQPQHSAAVINALLGQMELSNWLEEPKGYTLREPVAVEPVVDTTPGRLEIDNVRFEVGGKTLFLTNVGVRIRNLEERTLRDIKVRFYARPATSSDWTLIEEQTIGALPAGNTVVRDHLADSRKIGLVGADEFAVPSQYRIEVEHLGQVVNKEGSYSPIPAGKP